ncbi:hypothetical protein FB451DRAFT_1259099 [Mycena latifolia]|nr:hypothetical protein FB451DRAFT_1259099 [Mycena latifolia]
MPTHALPQRLRALHSLLFIWRVTVLPQRVLPAHPHSSNRPRYYTRSPPPPSMTSSSSLPNPPSCWHSCMPVIFALPSIIKFALPSSVSFGPVPFFPPIVATLHRGAF